MGRSLFATLHRRFGILGAGFAGTRALSPEYGKLKAV
jgi:hypothetical protein